MHLHPVVMHRGVDHGCHPRAEPGASRLSVQKPDPATDSNDCSVVGPGPGAGAAATTRGSPTGDSSELVSESRKSRGSSASLLAHRPSSRGCDPSGRMAQWQESITPIAVNFIHLRIISAFLLSWHVLSSNKTIRRGIPTASWEDILVAPSQVLSTIALLFPSARMP